MKYTRDIFVKKALLKHSGIYDYSKVIYLGSQKKVCITCHIHGDFWQIPADHLRGTGCPKCGQRRTVEKIGIKSTETFVKQSKEVHGDKYNYDKVIYEASKKKVVVTCPLHGDFLVVPNNHLNGSGCPRCKAEKSSLLRKWSTEKFIEEAKKVHNEKYDYSLVDYTFSTEKVKIICPKHGVFEQAASSHIRGVGCPHCVTSHGEDEIADYLNKENIQYVRQYTINNDFLFCNNRIIKVDFYIPSKKLFIEYNGEQHYAPIEHFGGGERFEKQKRRDEILRWYCKEHKVKLLEIPYYEKSIERLLKRALK